jgi:hypothetical protein
MLLHEMTITNKRIYRYLNLLYYMESSKKKDGI